VVTRIVYKLVEEHVDKITSHYRDWHRPSHSLQIRLALILLRGEWSQFSNTIEAVQSLNS
jgi:hypothetical protein